MSFTFDIILHKKFFDTCKKICLEFTFEHTFFLTEGIFIYAGPSFHNVITKTRYKVEVLSFDWIGSYIMPGYKCLYSFLSNFLRSNVTSIFGNFKKCKKIGSNTWCCLCGKKENECVLLAWEVMKYCVVTLPTVWYNLDLVLLWCRDWGPIC